VQSVVVTGVSTGIGWGIAKVMTAKGFRVFGSVRKQADADRLKAELGERFSSLLFDVTDEAAVGRGAAEVRAALNGERLWGLVNNAGIAVAGPLLESTAEEFRHQLEVNLVAPMMVIKAFAPLLGTDRALTGPPGRIVNISSVGGRFAAPFVGLYAASKHGLEGLSQSLRRELMLFGIDVIIVEPGLIVTNFGEVAAGAVLGAVREMVEAEVALAGLPRREEVARVVPGPRVGVRVVEHPRAVGHEAEDRVMQAHPPGPRQPDGRAQRADIHAAGAPASHEPPRHR